MTLYDVARGIAKMFLPIIYRLKFEGIENIPQDKSFILCSNHISFLDPVFIVLKIKSQCFFMGKQELFKNRIFGYLFRKLGAFPVNRGKGDTVAVEYAESLVKDGKIFAIFPEGTRSKRHEMGEFKPGAFKFAEKAGVPILPVTVDGGYHLFEETGSYQAPHIKVTIHPLVHSEEMDKHAQKEAQKEIENTIRSALD